MAQEAATSGVTDPLSGLIGPSLFPRTFRASAGFPAPSNTKDLDSIHSLMKSLELKSPEKLMNEAKRIVDGGAALLKSNLSSILENVGTMDATHAKGKDKPQERRPGLGLFRKRDPFSLKTNISQPTVTWKNNVALDRIEDPDEYFDTFERMEKANKEIQKQLGGSVDKFSLYKPSNIERRRRVGILGKTYTYKHRLPKDPFENDVTLMSSQDTADVDIPRSQEDNSQTLAKEDFPRSQEDNSQTLAKEDFPRSLEDNLQKVAEEDILSSPEVNLQKVVEEDIPGPSEDPNPDSNLEEVESAGSMKKTENEYSDILQEVLSFNYEDLQGHGALNILQEVLNIKPLDIEKLGMTERPDVRKRTSISTVSGSFRKSGRNSLGNDRALKNLNWKPTMEHKQVPDQVNCVSSPSLFGSISLLKKKISQPNPLRDPFSPTDVELSNSPTAFAAQSKDKLSGQVVGPFSPIDVELSESPNAFAALPEDKLCGQVDSPADLGMSNELESHMDIINTEFLVSNLVAYEDLGTTTGMSKPLVDENAVLQNVHNDSRPFEEPGNDADTTMNVDENEPNPSALGETRTPRRQQTDPQQPEVSCIPSAHGEGNDDTRSRRQTDIKQQPEAHHVNPPRRKKVAGEKRILKSHPMRNSLADAGTSFESGVRRSKRVKMRALEYWKGERFLYGRVDSSDSLKLIGVKYISPSKGNENLKVKPYISSESSKLKEFLEMES